MSSKPITPRWMFLVLWAAGIYNLLWGFQAIVFPHLLFDLFEMTRPNYPELWQCIGMIVGVYGLGYIIAAHDPIRHWPIVLIGFLGKVFGPIGFAKALVDGIFPLSFGWTIVTNDLIWWIPFFLILRAALRHIIMPPYLAQIVPEQKRLIEEYETYHKKTLAELSQNKKVLLIFLRHSGCTFCRETLRSLAKVQFEIDSRGFQMVFVHMSEAEAGYQFISRYQIANFDAISDPDRIFYRAFALKRGSFGQVFGPRIWFRGFMDAVLRGNGIGKLEGDGFQMPGVFILEQSKVIKKYSYDDASDRINWVKFLKD